MGVYHEQGRNIWETDVLCALAENAMTQGDFAHAKLHLEAAYKVLGGAENTWLQMLVYYFQGLLAYYEGDNKNAADLLEKTIQLATDGQFKPDLARSLISLGRVKLRLCEVSQAKRLILDGLALYKAFGHKLGISQSLEALAFASTELGEDHQGVSYMAVAQHLRQIIGAPLPVIERSDYDTWIGKSRVALGLELFNRSWSDAAETDYEEVLVKILSITDAHLKSMPNPQ
jgi:ATP/maltotriose-dependent transcriptional regulator MalT